MIYNLILMGLQYFHYIQLEAIYSDEVEGYLGEET